MLRAIWGADVTKNRDLMEKIWRFRHRHFVERFGWHAISRPDGREIDQFDTSSAIHLALLDGGEVLGYSRLLPTIEPHLLSAVYPQLMDGQPVPVGPTIFEWTRCVAEPGGLNIAGVSVSNLLLTGVLEYCLMTGITALIVETHPKLVNVLMTTGWDVTPLSAPQLLDGNLVLPIDAKPSPRALLENHQLYGINGSLIDIHASSVEPLLPRLPLKRLPFLPDAYDTTTEQEAV